MFLVCFILNILYYMFIKKSRFFSVNMFFHVLWHRKSENAKKSLAPVSCRILSFFLQNQFLFCKRCLIGSLVIPWFGDIRYAPEDSLRLSKPFCAIFIFIFFYQSDFRSRVWWEMIDIKNPIKMVFSILFLGPPLGVLGPVYSRNSYF